MTTEIEPVTLSGATVAPSWLNVALASSDDPDCPALYRTVLVEFHRNGIQLVATDSYMLLGSFVPAIHADILDAPEIDEAPTGTVVAIDPSRRMRSLMKHVLKESVAAEKDDLDPPDVTFHVQSCEDPDVPTLDTSLDRLKLVVSTDDERLSLPIYGGDFPSWRIILDGREPAATDEMRFSPALIGRLGSLNGILAYPMKFTLTGEQSIVVLKTTSNDLSLFGGLMPVGER